MGITNGMNRWLLISVVLFMISYRTAAQSTIAVNSIPANTPLNDSIYIAGDFQGWDPSSTAHILTKDTVTNTFYYTLQTTGNVEFKFTRGSWSSVESDASGNFVPDRTYTPVNGDTLYCQIQGWEDLNGNGGTGNQSTAAANVTIVTDSFYMPQFNRYRRIWIYLPPDYHFTSQEYPVLYMHDGQNIFDASTSFSGEWEVDETLNALHSSGDKGVIVVGIDNGGSNRISEYTPWSHPTYGGGDGADYMDFIVDDLIPYINANYRTLADRGNTGLMGSSLGGLISVYGALKYQNTFSKVGSLSPAYWINPEIFNSPGSMGFQHPIRFYQIMGTPEGAGNVNRMFQMENALITAGFDSTDVKSLEISDGQHSEWFWRREFEAAYTWLFQNNTSRTPSLSGSSSAAQIYPNPVLGSLIQMQLNLETNEQVTIELMDSTGSFSQKTFENHMTAGDHQITFNISSFNLAAGVYFCRVSVGSYSETLKFVLLK